MESKGTLFCKSFIQSMSSVLSDDGSDGSCYHITSSSVCCPPPSPMQQVVYRLTFAVEYLVLCASFRICSVSIARAPLRVPL